MKKNVVYLFDLDSTITQEEILPTIAATIDKNDLMRDLTEKTMMGLMPFEESFTSRVDILKDIPVTEVANMIKNIKLNKELAKFIKENKDRCYVVTCNLDVWISELMKEIGMEEHCYCSKAAVTDNKIQYIEKILSKEEVFEKFTNDYIIAVGDGSNDRKMLENAEIGIGFGGVRNIAPSLLEVCDYAIYDEKTLVEFLKVLKEKELDEK